MPGLQDPQASGPVGSERWTPVVTAVLGRIVHTISWHWLLLFNTAIGIFALLPILAPILMVTGHARWGRFIYAFLGLSCHQLPERSFFLFGPRLAYALNQLEFLVGPSVPLRYIGDAATGFKMAVCERDVAIYGSILLGGLLYGVARSTLARRGRRVPKLPVKIYLIFLLPMLVDGITQLMGLRESVWQLRLVTGMLVGLATVWLAYPHIDDAMRDTLRSMPAERASPAESTP